MAGINEVPMFAPMFVRLDDGRRGLAQMHDDLDALIDTQVVGRRVAVTSGDPVNMARFV